MTNRIRDFRDPARAMDIDYIDYMIDYMRAISGNFKPINWAEKNQKQHTQ